MTNHLCDLMPGTTSDDASLVVAPLSHGAGVHQLAQVARGAKTILLPTDRFDVPTVWALVEKWRVTNAFTVPTILKLMTEDPSVDRFDHSSLRYVIYAGAPMYRVDQVRALEKLGPVIVQYFGLGEVTGNITVLPPALHSVEDGPHARIGTCGFERTGMQVEIQDEHGKALAPGRNRRDLRHRPGRLRRLSRQSRGQREGLPQRLVPHRRSRPHGRGRLRLHHRPVVRHVYFGGLQHLSARDRGKDPPASGDQRGRGAGHSRPGVGRGRRRRLRGAAGSRPGCHRAGEMAGRQGLALQAAEARGLVGDDAEIRLRQDRQEGDTRGARAQRGARRRPTRDDGRAGR